MNKNNIIIRALFILLLFKTVSVPAAELKDLVGLWTSPGGNVMEIRLDANDEAKGYFFQLNDDWSALGARVGEMAIQNISVSPDGFKLEPQIRGEIASDEIAYAKFRKGTISGDTLTGELQDGYYQDDGKYIVEETYGSQVSYTRRPIIKSIKPVLLWDKIHSVKIKSDFFPQQITNQTIKVDGVVIQEAGRLEGDGSDTVHAIFKPGETITPGKKAVTMRNILSEHALHFYAFEIEPTIEEENDANRDKLNVGDTKRFKVVVTPEEYDDLTIDWEVTDERDEVLDVNWEQLDEFQVSKGKVDTEVRGSQLDITGVSNGKIEIGANITLEKAGSTLFARADKDDLQILGIGEETRIYSIVPSVLCSHPINTANNTGLIYILGENLDNIDTSDNALANVLGPGITLRKYGLISTDMLMLRLYAIAPDAKGDERTFSFKTKQGRQVTFPNRVVRIGHDVKSNRFLKLFNLDQLNTRNSLPLNAQHIIRRAFPDNAQFRLDYNKIFNDNPDALNTINAILDKDNGIMVSEQENYIKALSIFNRQARLPQNAIKIFNEINNSPGSYPKARGFYKDKAGGHQCGCARSNRTNRSTVARSTV